MYRYCCDLLEKSYFCSITNIFLYVPYSIRPVVICLKNRTFAVSQTSNQETPRFFDSCDLLEKSYFCSITNIGHNIYMYRCAVVICLKNRTFAVSQTSCARVPWHHACCDLLEKSYFCSITNIMLAILPTTIIVVICLKNRTFAVSQTSS